jgi:outer membrane lipoprotein SlyB
MKRKDLFLLASIAFVVLVVGCSSVDTVVAPDYSAKGVKSAAVVRVTGQLRGEAGRNQVADFFAMEFMRKGYRVVERQQVAAVLKEQGIQSSESMNEQQAVAAGKLLGVDAVVLVNIPEFDERMSLTAKVLHVKDGSALLISAGFAKTNRLLYTVGGAAVGAAVGALGGHAIGGDSGATVGGVGGGVLGGVAGEALSPQAAEKLQKLAKKMCDDLPNS